MNKFCLALFLCLGSIVSEAQTSGLKPAVDILSPDKPTGTLAYQKNEWTAVTASSTLNLLNYTGGSPGYVDRIFLAVSGADPSGCTMNVYLNGSGSPTISVPFQNFFMATYLYNNALGPTATSSIFHGVNDKSGNTSISGYLTIPVPFTSQVKIDFVNTTGSTITAWSTTEYQTGVPNTWPYTRILHLAVNTNVSGIAPNAVTNLVNYTGGARGRLVGMWLLYDGFPGSANPLSAPLEGDIALFLDGSGTPSIQSSGTEDWFGLGFYFEGNGTGGTGGGNTGQIAGGYRDGSGQVALTFVGNNFGQTEGAVRFHVQDKRYFNSGLKMTYACGDTTQVSFTGTCTIYSTVFYYTEQ